MRTIGFPLETILIFAVVALGALIYDLSAHKTAAKVSLGSAIRWSILYIALAVGFGGWVWFDHGAHAASLFFTGYALEKVLSVDNLIVFTAIFSYFGIPEENRHRVLHYGIIGAIVFRLIFVAIGTGSLALFGPWAEGVFAVIIGYTAWVMLRKGDDDEVVDHRSRWYVRWVGKVFPISDAMSPNFFVKEALTLHPPNGGLDIRTVTKATPLFLCLVAVEVSDILFAFDSVPAIIAVTQDPVIVYTAMIFAILGLRSLYFVLEALNRFLVHLEKAVIAVLFFIAFKLLAHATMGFKMNPMHSLVIVLGTLALGVVASWLFPERKDPATVNGG